MNLHKLYRFAFYLCLHSLVFYLIYQTVLEQFVIRHSHHELFYVFPFTIHLICCTLYFLLTWKDLYSYDYHYYLLSNKIIVLKNIMYTTLFVPGSVIVFCIFNNSLFLDPFFDRYAFMALILIICNIFSFLGINFFQSLWIAHLVNLGYLNRNVLIISDEDDYPLMDTLFLSNTKSRKYLGTLTFKNHQWYFHNNHHQIKKLRSEEAKDLICQLKIGEVIITKSAQLPQSSALDLVQYFQKNSIAYSLIDSIQKIPKKTFWRGLITYATVLKNITTRRDSLMQITVKRLFDLFWVSLSLFFFLPLGLIIALLIKLEDGGPVFYLNKRVGINGRTIKFYKFRSMIVNADLLKHKLLPFNQRIDGPLFKMKNDPRVTHIGRIIRKCSMDELPQLINVLKGDLSLVGPRPHLISEVKAYSPHDMLRLECIPGIICLPQIYGRNTLSFKKWVDLDLSYRKNWSVYFDLKILFKSFKVVVTPFFRRSFQ